MRSLAASAQELTVKIILVWKSESVFCEQIGVCRASEKKLKVSVNTKEDQGIDVQGPCAPNTDRDMDAA